MLTIRKLIEDYNINLTDIDLKRLAIGLVKEEEYYSDELVQLRIVIENLNENPKYYKKKKEEVEEDAPANSVAGGGVAGLTEPIMRDTIPNMQKKRKKFKSFLDKNRVVLP